MLLQQEAHFNDLSPRLREKLEERIKGFGKSVRYKFDISHPNPAPIDSNDVKVIYPSMYTLDPTIFNVVDTYEDRKDKQRSKKIALIASAEVSEKTGVIEYRYKKIRVEGKYKGILKLDVQDNEEHLNYAMFLELHPKLIGGLFSDRSKHQLITRIDETAAANAERAERSARSKARKIAEEMTEQEVIDFCDAMAWDSARDMDVMRNDVEALAEKEPPYFNDLVAGKKVEYQSIVKQALDRGIIAFDPAEYKFTYVGNSQVITVLTPTGTKSHIEKMAEWLQAGGKKADEVYKKIKGLVREPAMV